MWHDNFGRDISDFRLLEEGEYCKCSRSVKFPRRSPGCPQPRSSHSSFLPPLGSPRTRFRPSSKSARGRAVAANLWVRLPSDWIDKHRLREFSWKHGGEGTDNTAALMALIVIAHNTDQASGESRCTY